MKSTLFGITAVLILVFSTVHAQGVTGESVSMAYISLPFGSTTKVMPYYGLQLSWMERGRGNLIMLFSSTLYADLKFSGVLTWTFVCEKNRLSARANTEHTPSRITDTPHAFL